MPEHLKNISILIATVLCASFGQIFLKMGVHRIGGVHFSASFSAEILRILKDPILMGGFFLYALSAYLTLVALSQIQLSIFSIFTSLSYVIVLAASYYFFDEPLGRTKLIGCMFILIGVYFVSSK